MSLGDTHVLLDLGQGSLPRLFAAIPPTSLTAVAISHLHPDHFIDLVALRHYLRWEFDPPRRIRVLGPAGLADRLDALHGDPGFSAQTFDTETLGTGERVIGDLRLRATLVTHTAESYGIRVAPAAGGPGLVYSGDCGRATDLAPLIEPGDTLLSEVSFGPGPVVDGRPPPRRAGRRRPCRLERRRAGAPDAHPDGLRPRRDRALGRGALRRSRGLRVARIHRGAAGGLT